MNPFQFLKKHQNRCTLLYTQHSPRQVYQLLLLTSLSMSSDSSFYKLSSLQLTRINRNIYLPFMDGKSVKLDNISGTVSYEQGRVEHQNNHTCSLPPPPPNSACQFCLVKAGRTFFKEEGWPRWQCQVVAAFFIFAELVFSDYVSCVVDRIGFFVPGSGIGWTDLDWDPVKDQNMII